MVIDSRRCCGCFRAELKRDEPGGAECTVIAQVYKIADIFKGWNHRSLIVALLDGEGGGGSEGDEHIA